MISVAPRGDGAIPGPPGPWPNCRNISLQDEKRTLSAPDSERCFRPKAGTCVRQLYSAFSVNANKRVNPQQLSLRNSKPMWWPGVTVRRYERFKSLSDQSPSGTGHARASPRLCSARCGLTASSSLELHSRRNTCDGARGAMHAPAPRRRFLDLDSRRGGRPSHNAPAQ
jgi:hypothetical protein